MQRKVFSPYEIGDMLFPINRKIKNINRGGCGVFAAALCSELLKRGYNVKIVALSPWSIGTYQKRQHKHFNCSLTHSRLNGKEPTMAAHSHYMVKLGKYLIDSRGAFELIKDSTNGSKFVEYGEDFCTYYVIGGVSLPNMQYLNQDSGSWNNSFNRRSIKSVNKYVSEQIRKLYNAK